jgi:hypothetical protein
MHARTHTVLSLDLVTRHDNILWACTLLGAEYLRAWVWRQKRLIDNNMNKFSIEAGTNTTTDADSN